MEKRVLAAVVFITIILTHPGAAIAESGFEVYLFGIKIDSFEEYNWLEVTVGAVSSVLVHELGHALYLETSGKQWELRTSSSGLAIYTPDGLSDGNCKNLGRAGFALQTAIGTVLTSFEKTRRSDFTKGWVGINTVQLYTYNFREHNDGDDFQMIERGGGNPYVEQNMFTMLSLYNIGRLKPEHTDPVIIGHSPIQQAEYQYRDESYENNNSDLGSFFFNH